MNTSTPIRKTVSVMAVTLSVMSSYINAIIIIAVPNQLTMMHPIHRKKVMELSSNLDNVMAAS